jgi:hypothetical protein
MNDMLAAAEISQLSDKEIGDRLKDWWVKYRNFIQTSETQLKQELVCVSGIVRSKLLDAGVPLARRMRQAHLQWVGRAHMPVVVVVVIGDYELPVYRMTIGLPGPKGPWGYQSLLIRCSELTFIESDLAQFDGHDLAQFVENVCAGHPPHDWSLFSHDSSYPGYAWTVAANAFYNERHSERLALEKELHRRQRA